MTSESLFSVFFCQSWLLQDFTVPGYRVITHIHHTMLAMCHAYSDHAIYTGLAETSVGNLGSIPGWGRSPGEGNGNPLQYSCPGNSMDGGAW